MIGMKIYKWNTQFLIRVQKQQAFMTEKMKDIQELHSSCVTEAKSQGMPSVPPRALPFFFSLQFSPHDLASATARSRS